MSFRKAQLGLLGKPGCVVLLEDGSGKRHPHIILCEVENPHPGFLVVNITDARPDKRNNKPWRSLTYVGPSDDKRIKKESYVAYQYCRTVTRETVEKAFDQDKGIIKGVIENDELFKRIYRGALNSKETLRRYKKILRQNHLSVIRMRQNDSKERNTPKHTPGSQ